MTTKLTPEQLFLDSIDPPFGIVQEFMQETDGEYRAKLVLAFYCWDKYDTSAEQANLIINRVAAMYEYSEKCQRLYDAWSDFAFYTGYKK